MQLKKGLMLIALAAIVFAACKKEEDDEVPPTSTKTKMEMLTTGSWVCSDVLFAGISTWDSVAACEKDNYYTFKKDSTGTYDEGATKCDPADPQSEPITWMLSKDEKTITLDGDTATLALLTEKDMNIKMTVPIFGTIELRFKNK